jgi:predicted ATPase/DNA-binding winged helix-turn-helix (wHTH) protein
MPLCNSAKISFGSFHLLPTERLLLTDGNPVAIGSRAFDLLCALVERPGEVLGKEELMARVWPGIFVDEANLRVQIASLRRALGDDRAGRRYVAAVPGRGYSFVMPVGRSAALEPVPARPRLDNLPAALTPLIGRDETVMRLAPQCVQQRLVSVVGAGGIGKTSLALAVARNLSTAFANGVCFVDLTEIGDPLELAPALASALGVEACGDDLLATVLRHLADMHLLLVLDNCEQVIDAVAQLALALLRAARHLHILATSREPLRIESEHVHRLPALACPPPSPRLRPAEALTFPAVRLFVERAAAALGEFALQGEEVSNVVAICRKLEGVPLAIEAAAGDVEVFGVAGVASRLDDPLQLPAMRRPGLPPRHRSLRATMDWSYRLLHEPEQMLLHRLVGFADGFTLADATRAAHDGNWPESAIAEPLAALVAKSLVTRVSDEFEPRFRMPGVARAYVLAKQAGGAGDHVIH